MKNVHCKNVISPYSGCLITSPQNMPTKRSSEIMCKFRRKKRPKIHQLFWKRDFTFEIYRFTPEEVKRGKKYPVILVRLFFRTNMRLPTTTKINIILDWLTNQWENYIVCAVSISIESTSEKKYSSRAVSILICMAYLMNFICRLLVHLPVPSLHDRIIQKLIVNFVYTWAKLSRLPKINNHKLFQ